jgi:hypothetical protein
MLKIGIDPAFRKNGFSICILDTIEKNARFITFKNGFLDFIGWVLHDAPDIALKPVFIIENSNKSDYIFSAFIIKMNGQQKINYAKSVGKNMAASQYTCDLLTTVFGKQSVYELTPLQKGKKIVNIEYFKLISKGYELINYKGLGIEQDKRDAFMLALKNVNIKLY